jgi:DNA polymerase
VGNVTTFFGDTETFCETPLAHGLHRYAEKVEITILAWAVDDGPVEVIDCTRPGWEEKVRAALAAADAADEQVWQKSAFDRTVMRHAWGYEMPVEKVVDTMVQALAHGLPGSLDKLCSVLGVPTDLAKDKAGKQLVQLFCKPRPANQKVRRATRATHPIEWQRFLDYAGSDILSMREVRKRLPKWNYPGNQRERDLWVLDQKINDRGVAVDLALAEAAVRATDLAKKGLKAKTQELTGFDPETGQGLESTTQRDAFLKYLLGEFGVDLPDMQKGTLERRLADENLPEPVKDLLRIRLMATVSSTAKYKTLLRGTSSDGRLRGTLQFCGAARTGRWAGRLFQPQNLMRPTLKQQAILDAIEAFLADCADLVYDNVMNTAANCTRGALTVGPGKKMVSSDLANIEGRFLAWLAGEEWKLQAFRAFDTFLFNGDGSPTLFVNKKGELEHKRAGPDLYHVGAAEILGIKVEDVTDDQRQAQGKVPELACGYQGAVGAFQAMARIYGLEMSDARALEIVKAWRKKNKHIVELWYETERAAIRAAEQPGLRLEAAGGKLVFQRDGSWLRMRLPSGRCLCYPGVAVEDGKLTYMGVNQYTRKWERLHTYGGKLIENATQGGARDVLAHNMAEAEAAGFEITLTVHDELVTETIDSGQFTSERLSAIMSTVPPWATGLPLAASGWEGQRYRK